LWIIACRFIIFLLGIVWFALLLFTGSDYPFGIVRLS